MSNRYLALIPDPQLVELGYNPDEMERLWLCVAWEVPDYDKPEIIVDYYPIRKVDKEFHGGLQGERVYPGNPGMYRDGNGRVYSLQHLGRTVPIHRIIKPAPKPRAKEFRWVRGGWEKYTKSKGWHRC